MGISVGARPNLCFELSCMLSRMSQTIFASIVSMKNFGKSAGTKNNSMGVSPWRKNGLEMESQVFCSTISGRNQSDG